MSRPKARTGPNPKQELKELLLDCQVDPNNLGPWKVILETSGPDYLEARAYENISKAMKLMADEGKTIQSFQVYETLMKEATELITLARYKRGSKHSKPDVDYIVSMTRWSLHKGTTTAELEERKLVKRNSEEMKRKIQGEQKQSDPEPSAPQVP